MTLKEDYRKASHSNASYEEEIEGVNSYLDRMEEYIKQKMEIYAHMQNNLERMKGSAKNAEHFTMQMRQEQEEQTQRQANLFFNNGSSLGLGQNPSNIMSRGQLRPHIPTNNNFFNNFPPQYGDEQLL